MSIQLQQLLPDHVKVLRQWVDITPANDISPAYPFGGFVVNLNVATKGHRDWGDKDICMVIAITDCEGGALCLYEPGWRIELRNGDMVLFTSAKTTHFNLHFKGHRASLVFHSDREGDKWAENRNNWNGNNFFVST